MKNFFSLIAIIMALCVFTGCKDSDDNDVNAGTQPLHFDKNNLVFEAAASFRYYPDIGC